jgi:outer membrane protein TolC
MIYKMDALFSAAYRITLLIILPVYIYSQNNLNSESVTTLTLDQCINYALKNQPAMNQSLINQSIAKTNNAINLSGWLPQLSLSGTIIHYNKLPTTLIANPVPGGPPIATHNGVTNSFNPEFSATETLFDPQLLSSALTASLNVKHSEQITDSTKISIVASVSNSYYNLLLTLEQIKVLEEDTARLGRTVNDTHDQFVGGIVDETDYDQAVITLNNSKAQLNQQIENVIPGYASLKQIMGYPPDQPIQVVFDTTNMEQEIKFDTTMEFQYEKRIEYQQLQTEKQLQHQQKVFYELSFLPTVSIFYNYYFQYENNSFSELFRNGYPYSFFGLSFNLPLFTGFSRIENIHRSAIQEEILDLDELNLKSQIYKEYTSAKANYKSNLYNWHLLKINRARAKDVYDIVSLQYNEGIIPYLNLIIAESNLITAEIGYLNALFQVLSSKVDLEKAMGEITINY